MANDLQHLTPEMWSHRVQELLRRNLVAGGVANTEERATLKYGDKVHRPYLSDGYVQDYNKGSAITILDRDSTDESLTVDQVKVISAYVDDVDDIQNKYRAINELTERDAFLLSQQIDQKVLSEVSNAGLNNTPTTIATTTVVEQFSEAKAALNNNGVEMYKKRFAIIDPDVESTIEQMFTANGFKVADETLKGGYGRNGYLGEYLGLHMFCSQNLPSAVSLGLATQVTADDTVTINGVTFTFVASPSAAGDVDIGADAAGTVDNLVAAINGGAGAGTAYIELSAANRAKLKNAAVVATDNSTAVGLTAAGKMTLAETLTDGTDGFGTQTVDQIVGQFGCIDLVLQENVNTKFKDVDDKLGTNIFTWALYGTQVFNEGAERMYRMTIQK